MRVPTTWKLFIRYALWEAVKRFTFCAGRAPAALSAAPARFRVAGGAQVREFWHELEAATNARQAALFAALNGQLEVLARRIEAVVGDALDVALEPAALAIAPPTPEQCHADLRELFSTGARRGGPAHSSIL